MTAEIVVTVAESRDDLRIVATVDLELTSWLMSEDELAHLRSTVRDPLHLVAWMNGVPVGVAFAGVWPGSEDDRHLQAWGGVLPAYRRRGVGTSLMARLSEHGHSLGKAGLQVEVGEDDSDALGFFERRGYREIERQMQVVRDLADVDPEDVPEPPEGIRVVTRVERDDLLPQMYQVMAEASRDVPGLDGEQESTFEDWKAWEIDRPSNRPELCFIALDGDRVAGYAVLQAFDHSVHQGFTAVGRTWRRRGVGRALTLRQIAGAKAAGYDRLFCESEERNVPMRRLTESLGYRPMPAMVVLQGPLVP